MDVSVIIVNYNTKELTHNCLKSVFEQTKDVNFEVIVSDNGSSDGSIEMIKSDFPQVVLIENNANLGFGAANNRALKIAKGKYVFYLNSDTLLLNNAVKIFFDYWESAEDKEQLGALGCWLQGKEGNLVHSYSQFPNKKNIQKTLIRYAISQFFGKFAKLLHKRRNMKTSIPADTVIDGYITGADLFLKNNSNAYFDELFFMYFEETNLQYNNFYKRNLKSKLLSSPKIIHLEGGSEKKLTKKYDFNRQSSLFYWKSCLIYFKKNISSDYKKIKKLLYMTIKICTNKKYFSMYKVVLNEI